MTDIPSSDCPQPLTEQVTASLGAQPRLLTEPLAPRPVDGHTLVAQSLKQLGITHVYGVSGTPIDQTLAACAHAGMRPIGVRQQQAGVMMAIAQNYVAGRLTAIAILSAGPGITNATTGILVAHDNCWPLLVLGGRHALRMEGMGCFQELNAVPIMQSITKFAGVIESTADIPSCLSRAVHLALEGRPGPVYLDVPEDVLIGTVMMPPALLPAASVACELDGDRIHQAAMLLAQAQRPALIVGKGMRWSAPYPELKQLVEQYQIPFITSQMGRGSLPDDHPLCYNTTRSLLISSADVIGVLGARLDWTLRYGTDFAPDAQIIQVDIHEPELGRNRAPTVGVIGDLQLTLRQLLREMQQMESPGRHTEHRETWLNFLTIERDRKAMYWATSEQSPYQTISSEYLIHEIRAILPPDAISVIDGNSILTVAQQLLPSYTPASRLTPGSNGCIGVGIPFAIGAKVQHPERLVVAICGDTAFGLHVMEIETAIRHRIPVVIVVANNEGNGGALKHQTLYPPNYPERVTMFEPNLRYDQIVAALGGYTEFVTHPDQLRPALERAIAAATTACINVQITSPLPRGLG